MKYIILYFNLKLLIICIIKVHISLSMPWHVSKSACSVIGWLESLNCQVILYCTLTSSRCYRLALPQSKDPQVILIVIIKNIWFSILPQIQQLVSLQPHGIHLPSNKTEMTDSQTHFMVLFDCVHEKKSPSPAWAAALIAVTALFNTGIHSTTAVFNYNSPQLSDSQLVIPRINKGVPSGCYF